MSRRPPAGADRTEENRATLKQLVKLEANKSCADCKRNKQPRWASWNLGIFVCIRCSGIHRGMGTHISRVKSVDLDSWTDEQTQNMVRWGNARANRYWEHKLADGHVPNESKIENFIRTKYDSKRWAMDGPIPDPNTLGGDGDGADDDDMPLNVVRDKAIERSASMRNSARSTQNPLPRPPPSQRQPQVDLFGDVDAPVPVRPSTTEPPMQRPGPPKAPAAPPKQTKPGESLLGLDFFGSTAMNNSVRPASTGAGSSGLPGRADLKSSILSLYASKPAATAAAAAAPIQQSSSNVDAFGGMQSPQPQSNTSALGGLGDAFGSLSFSAPQPSQVKAAPFSNLTSPSGHSKQPSASKPPLSGGTFFDAKPASISKSTFTPASNPPPIVAPRKESFGNDFGDFSSGPSPLPASGNTSATGDLFGMSSPPIPNIPPAASPRPNPSSNSAFNLSSQKPAPAKPTPAPSATMPSFSTMNNMDAWGSNDAWATPDPPAQSNVPIQSNASSFAPAPARATIQANFDSGWGEPVATPAKPATPSTFTVQQDEEFGGWSHASPVATTTGPKQGGLGGNQDDLFGNVWG